VRFVHDAGPATKLLGAMQFEAEPTSAIITVDDDKIYHQRMLEVLLDEANLWHGSAVGFAGVTVSATSMCMYQRCIDHKASRFARVVILEGFASVLYPRSGLSPYAAMRKYVQSAPRSCQLSDDLLISNWLSRRNTSRVRVVQHDGLSQGDVIIGGYEDSASLHAIRSSKQLAPWHPEEMRKYRKCFLSRSASHHMNIEVDAREIERWAPYSLDRTGCELFSSRIQSIIRISDMERKEACEHGTWFDQATLAWRKS